MVQSNSEKTTGLIPIVFNYSWANRRKKRVCTSKVDLEYRISDGRISEFKQDLKISYPSDCNEAYSSLVSFFKTHPGVEERYILTKPNNSLDSRDLIILKRGLNAQLEGYYSFERPRKKLLYVEDGELNIVWDGFWEKHF